jgi:hypothetical protein
MAKLLAALNLPQVGEIKLLPADHPDDGKLQTSNHAVCCNLNATTCSHVWGQRVALCSFLGVFVCLGSFVLATVDQSGALFAIALNDREYMLRAAKQEDAEMWVTKLNVLKSNPQVLGHVNKHMKRKEGRRGTLTSRL